EGLVEPPSRCRARGPRAFILGRPDKYGNDRETLRQGLSQRRMIRQAQILTKPDDGRWTFPRGHSPASWRFFQIPTLLDCVSSLPFPCYSYRSAPTGSSREARRAGIQLAAIETPTTIATTDKSVSTSVGRTSYRIPARDRAARSTTG